MTYTFLLVLGSIYRSLELKGTLNDGSKIHYCKGRCQCKTLKNIFYSEKKSMFLSVSNTTLISSRIIIIKNRLQMTFTIFQNVKRFSKNLSAFFATLWFWPCWTLWFDMWLTYVRCAFEWRSSYHLFYKMWICNKKVCIFSKKNAKLIR